MSDDTPWPLWRVQNQLENLREAQTRHEADTRERLARLDAEWRARCAEMERELEQRVHKNDFEPIRKGFWGTITMLSIAAFGAILAVIGLRVPR